MQRNTWAKALLTAMIWLLVFQNPLQSIWDPFSYLDEFTALIGACLGMYDIVIVRKGRATKDQLLFAIPLVVFIAVGLAGNVIYRYQPLKCVIIDLYTNLKFFFAIGTGYYLFASLDREALGKTAGGNARLLTLLLFAAFLADRVFGIWPGQVRYGISSAVLFYAHPTYLSGALSFLLILLTAFYDRKNLPCIGMALTIMVFTLRAKAMASAAVYVAIFVFFLVFKWKLKIWHVAVAGAGSVAIAWNKIRFYFYEVADSAARSLFLRKSFLVMRDHFPIGTGFGTYGSAEAAKHYSPVYLQYGFNEHYQLRNVADIENTRRLIAKSKWLQGKYANNPESTLEGGTYLTDQFWPTVLGQTGALGTLAYLIVLGALIKRCLDVVRYDLHGYAAVLFMLVYLVIASFAEPAFFNAVAVPLAVVAGTVFYHADHQKQTV